MYYYGARYYDPKISIFATIDPMADKYPMITPYAYAFNNPLRYIDPTGMEGEDPPTYKVKEGNTLTQIAKDHKTTVDALLKANPDIKDKNKIRTGQTIKLSGSKNQHSNVSNQPTQETAETGFAGLGWSIGGTAAIGTLGLNIQLGVVDDGKWPMAFFSINHAVGVDISIEAGAFAVYNNNPNKAFRGANFTGIGGSYNLGVGPVSYSYGGDAGPNGGFPNNYTVHTVGAALGPSPATVSAYQGKTWTWPSMPHIGLLLPGFGK